MKKRIRTSGFTLESDTKHEPFGGGMIVFDPQVRIAWSSDDYDTAQIHVAGKNSSLVADSILRFLRHKFPPAETGG